MTKSLLLYAGLAIILSCSSAKNSANRQRTSDLIGKWVHVFEEDSSGEKQYRSEGYPVGPARFREQITFEKEGEVTMLQLAPNDAHEFVTGQWEWQADNRLKISFPEQPPMVWEVLELTSESLKIKN
ncbi:MAG TPA: hypothetical protein DCE41_03840 [Cytophagales bacterium]|nr:hypothetical protein [Cytophagales bacterium]HAA21204.1 hypothetical protein [Cytophagales bacterium]HAP60252.1 hypothetical protein [Cytophagales bacterium]